MQMSTTTTNEPTTPEVTHEVVSQIHEALNEEKWTRAALNSYTVHSFQELDEIVAKVEQNDLEDEVRELCEEHLSHTKNSIIALYISGLLDLARQSVDDANLIHLTRIFTDNHKWNIVEFLANRILEFGENRFALRVLADVYDTENETKKKHLVWERLIRVDYEEADIVRHLGEIKEQEGDSESAIAYYKKALHRYVTKKSFNQVKEIWHRLVALAPTETEFFYHAETKIARSISPDRAVQLLEDLYPYFKNARSWDTAIEILKRVLGYDAKNPWARKEIIECFQQLYADHSNLEEYIRVSNLNQTWRPIHEAIADFEKHIAFDTGNFVFHRTWGVGRIRSIEGDQISIDFAKKRGHVMSLKMAINALDVLPKEHLWVLRAVWKKEKLHERIKKNIVWALKMLIRSLGNDTDMKKIKAELVPDILTPGEWSSWSTKARAALKTNPDFGTVSGRLDHFMVRDQPISFEEKTYNKFKAEKTFFDRVKTFEELLSFLETEGGDGVDSEFFREMFEYFAAFLRSIVEVDEHVIAAQLVLRNVVTRYPFLKGELDLEFQRLYENIENVEEVFARIEGAELRRAFLSNVRAVDKRWAEVYLRLLPYHLSRDVITELDKHGKRDLVLQFVRSVYDVYREQREAFVWLVRTCSDEPWFDELGITLEKRLIALIHIFDLTMRDIDNRKDVSQNRKINRQVHAYLFRDHHLVDFLEHGDVDSVTRLFTLVSDVKDIEPKVVIDLKQRILNRFPNFRFYGEAEVEQSVARGFFVTPKAFEAKQKELVYLHEVEVPENSKEIERARSYGDLRENAEYKAAMERQDSLNSRAARLKVELEQARVVKRDEVKTDSVQFGVMVKMTDLLTNAPLVYTILGPWESNPDRGVISYQSPLGNRLYNSTVGDVLDFEINEKRYSLRIEALEMAEF